MNRTGILKCCAAAAIAGAALLFTFGKRDDFGLGRTMEIAVNMMRELSLYFVDEVDPDKLLEGAAQGMVSHLDPYTEYLSEAEMSDFDVMTTGKYGGVGSLIRKKGDYVIFAQPYKDSPADKAGLRIGDKILAIDGEDAKGFTTEEVSKRMRGAPGTTFRITVERLLGGRHETLTLRRERIAIPGVPYAGWAAEGIGYIQHSDFTEGCYDDMRSAIDRLRREGDLRGLVLDYRGNGGGILQEAVKILSMFVPKGTEVVTTKGRTEGKSFRTSSEPILPDLPLAVLVNGNTASAAEIVAGALQDLDRAVVIGQRSFGKGLVQTTRPLGYNAYLKLTTAKYYIPSGRCIQAVDYSRAQEGSVREVPDSLIREYATRGGRKVYDGGGIMPDVFIPADTTDVTKYFVEVSGRNILYRYTIEYADRHREALNAVKTIDELQALLDSDKTLVDDFVRYAARKGVAPRYGDIARSRRLIEAQLRAYIGRNTTLEDNGFYANIYPVDNVIVRAIGILKEDKND